jgi:hypothetical protein
VSEKEQKQTIWSLWAPKSAGGKRYNMEHLPSAEQIATESAQALYGTSNVPSDYQRPQSK